MSRSAHPSGWQAPVRLLLGVAFVAILLFPSAGWAGDYAAEISRYRAIIAADPTDSDAAYRLGKFLAWDNQYPEAIAVLKDVLAKAPTYKEAEITLAQVYGWSGDRQKAIEAYTTLLQKYPENLEAYQGLGSLTLWENDFEKSINYFRRALEVNPGDITSLKGIARAYQGRGDRRRADEYFNRVQIAEFQKTPLSRSLLYLSLIAGAAAGGIWVLGRFRRRQKMAVLTLELRLLRQVLVTYHLRAGRFPLALENLIHETWRPPLAKEELPYLAPEGLLRGDRGFLIDPFGRRFYYNPDTGVVSSTSRGAETL